MKRVHVIYRGRVQGVGFRFTAIHLASKFGINGWVKNLFNADVELVAEGEEKSLMDFLASLEEGMTSYIRNKEIDWTDSKREFKSFDIRY